MTPKSTVWTALYGTPAGCRYMEFGQPDGPKLDIKLVRKLSKHHCKPGERVNALVPGDYKVAMSGLASWIWNHWQ